MVALSGRMTLSGPIIPLSVLDHLVSHSVYSRNMDVKNNFFFSSNNLKESNILAMDRIYIY